MVYWFLRSLTAGDGQCVFSVACYDYAIKIGNCLNDKKNNAWH